MKIIDINNFFEIEDDDYIYSPINHQFYKVTMHSASEFKLRPEYYNGVMGTSFNVKYTDVFGMVWVWTPRG